jgi:hypothetical protein
VLVVVVQQLGVGWRRRPGSDAFEVSGGENVLAGFLDGDHDVRFAVALGGHGAFHQQFPIHQVPGGGVGGGALVDTLLPPQHVAQAVIQLVHGEVLAVHLGDGLAAVGFGGLGILLVAATGRNRCQHEQGKQPGTQVAAV